MSDEAKEEVYKNIYNERNILKIQVIAILNNHLESIKEARKDTAGLGMLQHVVKMILREVEGL
jgi:hypothetical protein